ncbi:MAG TPA: hypothetical protein VK820_01045 [Steroidobacteraceae bacterium]|jgi:hypothetical protein|nr:hypothetical protein [Steroidobacteraceae bacterium]
MNTRVLGVIALTFCGLRPAAGSAAATPPPPPSQPASYVFATELGSGVYDVAGRTLLVYRLPLGYDLREATEDAPGLRLTLPAAVGFFNYSPIDLVHTQLPAHVGAFSFVPGLKLDYKMDEHWHIEPYARAGASFASDDFDGWLYGLGVSSTYQWQAREVHARVLNDILFAGVIYRSPMDPNDNLVRLRNGLELSRLTGLTIGQHMIELSVYGFADYFPDAPRPPVTGTRPSRLQVEPGFLIGAVPQWKIRSFELPRLGIGYRFAGDLSGWHLDISVPF